MKDGIDNGCIVRNWNEMKLRFLEKEGNLKCKVEETQCPVSDDIPYSSDINV